MQKGQTAVVESNRLEYPREVVAELSLESVQRPDDASRSAVRDFYNNLVSGSPLGEHEEPRLCPFFADDGIALPMSDLLAGLDLRRALLDTPAPRMSFLPYFLILPLVLAFLREVFVCDMREDIAVVDIFINRGPAKSSLELLEILLLVQEGAHGDRGIVLAEYLFLDKLGDGEIIPYLEGSSLCGEPLLIFSLGL